MKNLIMDNNKFSNNLILWAIVCVGISVAIQRIHLGTQNVFLGLGILLMILAYRQKQFILPDLSWHEIWLPFAVYAVCITPSVIFSPYKVDSIKYLFNAVLLRPLIFFVVLLLADYIGLIKKMFWGVAAVFSIEGIWSFYQWLIHPVGYRANGFGGFELPYACCCCMFYIVFLIFVIDDNFSKRQRCFGLLGLVCCILAIIAGESRGAWLTIFVETIVIAVPYYLKSLKKVMLILILLFAVAGGIFSVPHMRERFLSIMNVSTNASNVSRLRTWEAAYTMFKDYPLTGIGMGAWKKVYPVKYYKGRNFTEKLVHAHNVYLHQLAEGGIFALFGYLFLMGWFLKKYFNDWLKKENPFSVMCIGVVTTFGLYAIIENIFSVSTSIRTFWFLMGALTVLSWHYIKKDR